MRGHIVNSMKFTTRNPGLERKMDRQLEIRKITYAVAQAYNCFGRGSRVVNNSPIERALADRPPSFAADVDVASVVAFVLGQADKLRS